MIVSSLKGCQILVVEDEFLLADELRTELERNGAKVIGPVGGLSQALAIIAATSEITGAVLDINLRGDMVFPAAAQLQDRGVPTLFVSGYDSAVIPPRFKNVPRCEKPIAVGRIIENLARAVDSA
jgi:DNA-binding NtrC family response regulator